MWIYILPLSIFIIITAVIYHHYKNEKKKSPVKIVLPGLITSILVFVCIKYKDHLMDDEPMMGGNYFE